MTAKRKVSSSKKRKSKIKKGKVYIAPYKIIMMCASIIAVCMTLLLITTVVSKNQDSKESAQISSRFEDKNTTETTKESSSSKSKAASGSKAAANTKSTSTTKSDNSKTAPEPKKAETSKNSSQKSEAAVTSSKTANQNEKITQTPQFQESVKTEQNKAAAQNQVASAKTPSQTQAAPSQKSQSPSNNSSFSFPQAKNGAQLIFVFDDGGQNLNQLEKFVTLPFPITVAVLPKLTHSKEAAQRIRISKNEVILHQPMQALNQNVNPGPGAITPSMSDEEVQYILRNNIEEIWPISGLNNHEGSAITADAEKMEIVLKTASSEGIYFLDSRTNADTKVPEVAKALGYSYYERNIFLDNTKTKENALNELKKGLDIANKNGFVIMIGHVWSADFLPQILAEAYPELKSKGYTFSVVSKSKAQK